MKYKYIGTEEQLIENGFKPYYDADVNGLTSYSRPYKDNSNEVMVAWDNNCAYDKRGIGVVYNFDDVLLSELQDLIDKGLVEVIS